MSLPPNLCYTIALDQPGQDVHRRMARLLVTSLIRTGWHGRIVVFRNGDTAVLPGGHPQVEEQLLPQMGPFAVWDSVQWKYRVRDRLDLTGIGKVLFLDCDVIALRSINHLMLGAWDIYTTPEPSRIVEYPFNGYLTEEEMVALSGEPGLNAGTFAIRASRFLAVMEEWERLDAIEPIRRWIATDQHSWNRLVLDTPLRHRHFGQGEVQFPFIRPASFLDYRSAALVHAADQSPEQKFSLLYGLWMGAFGRNAFEQNTEPAPR
jgi:hypothetical protein